MSKTSWLFVIILGFSVTAIVGILAFHRSAVDVDELFAKARLVAVGKHPEKAIPLLEDVLKHDDSHPQALLFRGQLALQQGDTRKAIAIFQRIDSAPPHETGTARFLEANAWYARRRARMAEKQFLAAISLHPTFLKSRESLIQLYYIQARSDELQEQLDAIREFRIWNQQELFASQLIMFPSSLPFDSISILEGFVAADPNDILSRIALARHYLSHDRTPEAIELLNKTKILAPENLAVHAVLAECHLQNSDIQAAWQQLQNDTATSQNPTRWWRALGRCASEVGLWAEAVSAMQFAVAGNPNDFEAAYLLGTAAQRCGQTSIAEKQLERARITEKLSTAASILLKSNGERQNLITETILNIGEMLLDLQRPEEATPWLSAFLTMHPNHKDALSLWNQATTSASAAPLSIETATVDPAIIRKIEAAIEAAKPGESNQTQTPRSATIRLRDIHADVGLEFQYFNGKTDNNYLTESVGGGVAVLDIDGDNWPDLFFPNGSELGKHSGVSAAFSDQLYRNIDGTHVERVNETAGVSSTEFGQGCVACDYNSDGFQDLLVGTLGRILVYQNQGDGTFAEVAEQSGISGSRWTSSLAMSDLDHDGDPDLYVANYVKEPFVVCRDDDGRPTTCSPANFEAEQDLLFINEGNGQFRDVTQTAGIKAPDGKGLGIVIADFDSDGWQDIYVANDGEQNFLFKNRTKSADRHLSFEDAGLTSGAAVSREGRAQAGMGIACDDFDHNGQLDLYVTNFYHDYNALYLNQGNLLFLDETQSHQLVNPTMTTLGFGTQSVDLDLDGWGEIFVANGHIYDRRFEDIPWQMPPHCFRRTSDGTYEEISNQIGPYFHERYIGRGVARLDFDQDQRPDIVAVHQDRPVALLINETQLTGHAIILKLRGIQSNRDAIGARIELRIGTTVRVIEVTGGDGYYASNERTMIIGVGKINVVPEVLVRWPSGQIDQLADVPTDTMLVVLESREPVVIPNHLGKSQ